MRHVETVTEYQFPQMTGTHLRTVEARFESWHGHCFWNQLENSEY